MANSEKKDPQIKIAIAGAAGRMGRRIVALAAVQSDLRGVAAIDSPGSEGVGKDAGELAGIGPIGVRVADRVAAEFDVLIDFSSPAGTDQCLATCVDAGRPIVIGTTGQSDEQMGRIREASSRIAVLKSANMSVGVNVMLRVVRQLAELLDEGYDIEITEAHHRFKVDAPSGTALALLEAVKAGRKAKPSTPIVHGRQGNVGQRPSGEIGIHSQRIGDTVGEHTVAFGTLGETLSIHHSAHSRDTFALGALRAAKWLVGKPAGLYNMQDVLFGGSI
ncbi:MAG TPA: 4-hydroxy-tetrahydrodipicolinate reductase [Phycisphaerae bacterium]|nr:4-hydroxy-tetrahydrodipicolinate reductase [Phycisphaerae bacterium]